MSQRGVNDLAVGCIFDDDYYGSIYIYFLTTSGAAKSYQKISNSYGNLPFTTSNQGHFGHAIGFLGDQDGDGVTDILVSEPGYGIQCTRCSAAGITYDDDNSGIGQEAHLNSSSYKK